MRQIDLIGEFRLILLMCLRDENPFQPSSYVSKSGLSIYQAGKSLQDGGYLNGGCLTWKGREAASSIISDSDFEMVAYCFEETNGVSFETVVEVMRKMAMERFWDSLKGRLRNANTGQEDNEEASSSTDQTQNPH